MKINSLKNVSIFTFNYYLIFHFMPSLVKAEGGAKKNLSSLSTRLTLGNIKENP